LNTVTNTAQQLANVHALLADNRLREAIDTLIALPDAAVSQRTLRQLQGQLAALEQDALRRTETPENIEVRRNQLRESILTCTEHAAAGTVEAKPDTIAGENLKKHAFRILLVGKILLLLFVAFHFHIHAFSQGETLTLLVLLSPVLVGYLLTALQGQKIPGIPEDAKKNVPFLRGMVYIGLPLYFLLILWMLRKVPLDEWNFETARNWIAGIEVAFGALVAYLVKTLFSEKT